MFNVNAAFDMAMQYAVEHLEARTELYLKLQYVYDDKTL